MSQKVVLSLVRCTTCRLVVVSLMKNQTNPEIMDIVLCYGNAYGVASRVHAENVPGATCFVLCENVNKSLENLETVEDNPSTVGSATSYFSEHVEGHRRVLEIRADV
ncbi:hypothetical protein TcasGA2_TC011575 [Tribolium castaneum]|uniref:Uncharacterized protein n=1 Tax=Tribolium castaneum TaxID=7070 RepID=D7ELH6_TRICA|nr:hypothetical protein TcasGA2_TC011575 [Tribolium castaneum]